MTKVGVVNRLRMRIVHILVEFPPPPLNSPASTPDIWIVVEAGVPEFPTSEQFNVLLFQC